MFVRFVKKFSKYAAVVLGYVAVYGVLSYTLGLIAPWLFPAVTIVAVLGAFAYISAREDANHEKHEAEEADRKATHELLMAQLKAKRGAAA